ncbi:putative cytochrome P450 6a14 [Cryptotermes secundus]|uniref:Putative cytochrome P450 6a14 n=2 Tax=Cryptotermes secundus TaxID=105785 RepID=A0A2J7QT71_9NEOP|nr:probable cytochrome P450 6a13 isoform X6 [Cryptotermes secundus]PNF31791.1 putative cytochrome P450 6a14 [Cryptotermes secundus]
MGFLFESLLLGVGVLVACVLSVVYAYFKWSFTYWKKRNVPYVEPCFPFGNFKEVALMRKEFGYVIRDIYTRLEGHRYGGVYIISRPRLFLLDPDLIKDVLVKDFSTFHDRGVYMNEETAPLSGHLFSLPGKRWRNLRIKLTPTFTSGKMKMMFQRLVECGDELKLCLENIAGRGEVIEVKDILARFSTDVISSCAFGIECNCLNNDDAEFRQWGRKIFEPSIQRIIIGILSAVAPVVLDKLKLSIFDSDVSKYFLKMVQETVEYREKNNVKRNDFMQLLIQLKEKGSLDSEQGAEDRSEEEMNGTCETADGLSMNSLAAQAFVFFLAGFETSSTTMTFCLYEMSVNPDIQERLRTEIDMVLEKHDGKLSYEAVQEMSYLDKVVSETLRKYPPLPTVNRESSKKYKIPETDIVLDTGTRVFIPVIGLHHDPKYYPEPDRFDPERFSEEEKQKRHHYVYLPFGEGPRICIGMRFGLMQTKVGLVSLLSKYQFSVSKKTPVPLMFDPRSFILAPAGGMWLQIKKRSMEYAELLL